MSRRREYPFVAPPPNKLLLTLDLSVDMRAFATWPPENTKAFFNGLALVYEATSRLGGECNGNCSDCDCAPSLGSP